MPHPRSRRLSGVAAAAVLVAGLGACAQAGDPSAEAAGTTRAIATAFGDVTVPEAPKRVIALSEAALDTALALGVKPIGTTARRGGDAPPAYLTEATGIPVVATVSEPNLEEIVKAEPDLILAATGLAKAQYDKLAAVAPTVVPEPGLLNWEKQLGTYAAALGRKPALDEKLAGLRARAAAVKAEQKVGATAVVLRWMPNGAIVMNAGLMPGAALKDAGTSALPISAGVGDKPHTDPLSLENLSQVDADHIFIGTFDEEGQNALAAARKQPAFARLKAAEAGAVTAVDGGVWTSSSGPIAWDRVLDDIEKAYAG
jgi:iron complex transport system substrate-binding protein